MEYNQIILGNNMEILPTIPREKINCCVTSPPYWGLRDYGIEPTIQAGCPKYVCKKCGKARVKILEPTEEYREYLGKGNLKEHHVEQETKTKFKVKTNAEYNIKGYTDCGCNAGFEGGVILDPFSGAGTTAVVARKQGKRYIGIEIKQEYIDMANKRIGKIPETLF